MTGCVESSIHYKVPGARGEVMPLYKHIDFFYRYLGFLPSLHSDKDSVVYMYDQFGIFGPDVVVGLVV